LVRRIEKSVVVNPGSVGQPKDGDPSASYAVWEDGQINLRRAVYPIEHTVRSYASTPLKASDIQCFVTVLRTGGELPSLPP
jgi:diadenosine tetraphosphatase ApaH/serine/threonine PP2A family protein phosphatase